MLHRSTQLHTTSWTPHGQDEYQSVNVTAEWNRTIFMNMWKSRKFGVQKLYITITKAALATTKSFLPIIEIFYQHFNNSWKMGSHTHPLFSRTSENAFPQHGIFQTVHDWVTHIVKRRIWTAKIQVAYQTKVNNENNPRFKVYILAVHVQLTHKLAGV